MMESNMSHLKLDRVTIGPNGQPVPIYRVKRNVRQPVGIILGLAFAFLIFLIVLGQTAHAAEADGTAFAKQAQADRTVEPIETRDQLLQEAGSLIAAACTRTASLPEQCIAGMAKQINSVSAMPVLLKEKVLYLKSVVNCPNGFNACQAWNEWQEFQCQHHFPVYARANETEQEYLARKQRCSQ
jgi:hypothetical protein